MTVQRGTDDNTPPSGSSQKTGNDNGGVFGQNFNATGGAQTAGNAQRPASSGSRSAFAGQRGAAGRIASLRTGVGRRRPAADLEEMQTTFNEEFRSYKTGTSIPEAQNFKLIMIDRSRLNKKVDLLVAVLPVQKDGALHVAIHTMLIADANDRYDATVVQVGPKQHRYSTVVGDAYTAELFGAVVDIVSADAGAKIHPYDAGHQTLPAEMDVKDKVSIHKIAFFVSEALTRTAYQSILQTTDDIISMADLSENAQTSAVIDFRSTEDLTAAGLPIRTDFSVKLRYSDNTRQGDNQASKAFDLDQHIPLGGAEGFVDITYSPPEPAGIGQQQATQHYYGQVILTRLDTDQDLITPELQMLSLLGMTLIARNLNWARVWSPSFRGFHQNDLHDIGAIGFELPGPGGDFIGRINTTSSTFDDAALAKLVQTAIRRDPLIGIDIEESGELSWLNRTLLEAAEGSAEANASIVATLDNLANGLFSKQWPNNARLLFDGNNRIHLGYYTDDQGVRRDIRQLDYLMVLNRYGESDPRMVEQWQATFDDVDTDADIRLAEREDLIHKILGPTVVITGYARRAFFNPDGLNVGLDAVFDAGLRIKPENTLIGFGQTSVRGRQDLQSLSFGGNSGRNVFTHGTNSNRDRGWARGYRGGGQNWR